MKASKGLMNTPQNVRMKARQADPPRGYNKRIKGSYHHVRRDEDGFDTRSTTGLTSFSPNQLS